MKFITTLSLLIFALSLSAQDSTNFPTIGNVKRIHKDLDQLIKPGTKIEVITSGFTWSEGPVWSKEGSFLLFSDIPANSTMKWIEGEGVSTYLTPSGYTGAGKYGSEPGSNGLAYNSEGRLISAEHGDRRISLLTKNGGKRTLADNYKGKRFHSPNDLVLNSKGEVYFTDPPYGLPGNWKDPRRELDFCGVYLLRQDGEVILLTDEFTRPNGVTLSPDEKTAYVTQSDHKKPIIKSFQIKKDGTWKKGKVFYDFSKQVKAGASGLPDGIKTDAHGNIWSTGPGGISIFNNKGKLLGIIETGENTSNCAFGGPDGNILYITADTYIMRIQTKVKGARF